MELVKKIKNIGEEIKDKVVNTFSELTYDYRKMAYELSAQLNQLEMRNACLKAKNERLELELVDNKRVNNELLGEKSEVIETALALEKKMKKQISGYKGQLARVKNENETLKEQLAKKNKRK